MKHAKKRTKLSLFVVLALIAVSGWSWARMITVVGGGVAAAAPAGGGTVGQMGTLAGNETQLPQGAAWFTISQVGAGNGGSVRYAHILMHSLTGNSDTMCLSLQENSDGGTVRLSGSAAAPTAGGWLNIDMGSSFTVVEGTYYRLVAQCQTTACYVERGAFGSTPDTRRDESFSYSCGGSVTNDSQAENRTLFIIFNNTAGDPS